MKLEVLINNGEPKIYSLDRDKIVIGSNENSHIIINDPSISRKHAIILVKDDRYYISDQGSINGTFIGDETLTPGRRVEMSIYSPVRLGTNVLLTLITEEEASELEQVLPLNEFEVRESEDKTLVISYAELKKKHTEEMQRKRTSQLTQRKKKAKKKNSKWSSLPSLIVIAVLGGLILYKKIEKKPVPKKEEAKTINQGPLKKVKLEDLLSYEFLLEKFNSHKCSSDIEKSLCLLLPSINHKSFGPIVIDQHIIIFADYDLVKEQASNSLPQKDIKERDLHLMSLVIWIQNNISDRLNELKNIDDYKITIALLESSRKNTELKLNAMFIPSSLLRFQDRIRSEDSEDIRKNGVAQFYYYLDYGRFADVAPKEAKNLLSE